MYSDLCQFILENDIIILLKDINFKKIGTFQIFKTMKILSQYYR